MTQANTPPPSDMVTLTIDGKTLEARKGTLLVEAARTVGIEIPVFCYHPKLKPVGACRMCLVQIEKLPRLQTACTTPVAADMAVHTVTPEVLEAQNGVIELLLANHPLDCPICDKGGECPLQDNTFAFGRGVSRFTEAKRRQEKALPLSDRIVLDRERCIMCFRCVRFHQEIPGDEVLAAVNRGSLSEIATLTGESYDSIYSGNTVELCPVGALTSRQYRFRARPWDLVRTPSVCSGCAVGCNLEIHSRTEQVERLTSRENPDVDGGWLCDLGRFDTMPAPWDARPTRPMVRENGALRPAAWDEAINRAAALLREGGAVVASPSLTNEALWLLEGHLRPALGAELAALWPRVDTPWPVQGAIANILRCKTIVLVGLDAWHELPVLALRIRKAVLAGATLVVVGEQNGLFRDTAHWLKAPAGQETAVAAALAATLGGGTAREAAGVPAEAIQAAAAALSAGGPAAVLVGADLARGPGLTDLQALAAALGADGATGLVGAPALAANGRGALELAPVLARTDPTSLLAAAMSDRLSAVLLLGDEAWSDLDTGSARRIVATSAPLPADDARIDVVLPLAHPYERQGTITNLEGRVQYQEGGASPPPRARADWGVVAHLAAALGAANPPRSLPEVRQALLSARPTWAPAVALRDGTAGAGTAERSDRDPAYAQTVVPPFGARASVEA